ncbi:hypothetical protein L1987_37440 [Smallanthus sonchifolius]|uniref:Uncharacterized protein n=1 Tax=Smallanthus sonchifolius TaxID=185202 RepID=A0ACB9HHR0_9ASTR|nr:hypothetical protein L1987_37440 [Smallanthus sonchifolius]
MPTRKKNLIPTTTTVTVGCGSRCRRLNLSKIFNPKPKNKHKRSRFYQDSSSLSASTSWTTTPTATNATLSPTTSDTTAPVRSSRALQGSGWLSGSSLAVEKDSSDPYVDFRDSMLQMIVEKEIYGKDDLQELLNCFLQLNSPYYHAIIVRAFTEIWNNISK